jgi:hypothetical protein
MVRISLEDIMHLSDIFNNNYFLIKYCSEVKLTPNFSRENLKEINTKISKMGFDWCLNLEHIGSISRLKYLGCIDCPKFYSFSYYEGLDQLFLKNCPSFSHMPHIKGLKWLHLENTKVDVIPHIVGLERLIVIKSKINYIPNIKGLRTLDCSDNPLVEFIPIIIGLSSLICNNCPKLRFIWSRVKMLSCVNCPLLVNVPKALYEDMRDCKWIKTKDNQLFDNRLFLVKKIQKFVMINNIRKLFKKCIKDRRFIEWVYHPNNIGGKCSKKELSNFVSHINADCKVYP